ncbi:ATP-dependent protease ATPase subunit HslU [Entomospira culicis]|uniref:ATP-dependent protease ATPase subunit HslU n=1 Tax=Entomospira culicis TaxID=2719989 RepID=A0A968GFD0_9SPIO|nr:ATP-dependent protease ATPase subunit HslU [Entomospira culicis]NIZ19052.1 ATP-dependent protease ATPase subunit HslU [Entomospira culicis]NIZ69267.1 ATP-dependent protease ATPase subunit HslU [Entomospira culicis]WDI37850.1 ATP-dependent protease ATPase subunit HslU [Entomospira culicis]WDI39478.1 ATP-dependent protease ATPase subunit HslU [Entomospira culicis]
MFDYETMTPKQLVAELDKYIIGQDEAKRAVAVALRNRVRRGRLPEAMRDEVSPKNIIMVGSTGVGKTEIARRLTKLSGAPFIKVEATKFTEVGYVGRDVESMVRDLMNAAISLVKAEMEKNIQAEAEKRTYDRLLDLLLPGTKSHHKEQSEEDEPPRISLLSENEEAQESEEAVIARTRAKLLERIKSGQMDDHKVELSSKGGKGGSIMPGVEVFPVGLGGMGDGPDFSDMGQQISSQISAMFGGGKKKVVSVKRAYNILMQEEREQLIDQDAVIEIAKERVERRGIIFIDEIDKIISSGSNKQGGEVSREGVQRDILPIVEGSMVNTKYGMIDTTYILFIAAGAFSNSKPSDLIPELQGRFPIRVQLEEMSVAMFEQILIKPQNAITQQYIELLKTEDLFIEFDESAIKRIAEIAYEENRLQENIGARRLHNILERILETLSFEATDRGGEHILIDATYVDRELKTKEREANDLGKYVL